MKIQAVAALLPLALFGPSLAWAQDPGAPAPAVAAAPPAVVAAAVAPPAADSILIPAGTVVDLELVDALSSRINHRGDLFSIRLSYPILVNGVQVVPAGVLGVAEVTTASKATWGGKPGELMILARYLDYNGVRIPLRGLQMGLRGKDNLAVSFVVIQLASVAGLFIQGGEVVVPTGAAARAKLATDIYLPHNLLPAPAPAAPVAAPEAVPQAAPVADAAPAPATPSN